MIAIVATDCNWGIGKDNKLLFHVPEDMEFFKRQTVNNVVVMGRKTLDSLPGGKPLPDRMNLVLTNSTTFQACGVNFYRGDIPHIESFFEKYDPDDIFIIGGASIYNHYLARCDKVYRTVYKKSFDADTYFPDLPRSNFKLNRIIEQYEHDGCPVWIEEWENLGVAGYEITGSLSDYKGIKYEFAIKDNNSDVWEDPYGMELPLYQKADFARTIKVGNPDIITTEIESGIYRSTYIVTHDGLTAKLDGYGGTEATSAIRVKHYRDKLYNAFL